MLATLMIAISQIQIPHPIQGIRHFVKESHQLSEYHMLDL